MKRAINAVPAWSRPRHTIGQVTTASPPSAKLLSASRPAATISANAPGTAWRPMLSNPQRCAALPMLLALLFPIAVLRANPPAFAAAFDSAVRIKDITDVEGVRENQLVGYGLVVGLNGTGDNLLNAAFTRESLVSMLERLGVNTRDRITTLVTKDVAAVMVTASLPAFSRSGTRIDVGISAIGDSSNLAGGTLLVTPMLAADGEVYGVAQGAVTTGAVAARGAAASRHAQRADIGQNRQRRHCRARDRIVPWRASPAEPCPAQPGPYHRAAH
jgi:hypothetical protein